MLFTLERAEYVAAVLRAVDKLGTDATATLGLTDRCPECGERPDALDYGNGHTVGTVPASPQFDAYLIIGCEGYWVVDPNKVGIERAAWQPVEES